MYHCLLRSLNSYQECQGVRTLKKVHHWDLIWGCLPITGIEYWTSCTDCYLINNVYPIFFLIIYRKTLKVLVLQVCFPYPSILKNVINATVSISPAGGSISPFSPGGNLGSQTKLGTWRGSTHNVWTQTYDYAVLGALRGLGFQATWNFINFRHLSYIYILWESLALQISNKFTYSVCDVYIQVCILLVINIYIYNSKMPRLNRNCLSSFISIFISYFLLLLT